MHAVSEFHNDISSPVATPPMERQFSHTCISETWNNDQIDDFVRKLGFLETQSIDVEQRVKLFQQLNQVL